MDTECDLNSVSAYLSLTTLKRVQIIKSIEAFLSLTMVNDKYALITECDLDTIDAYLSLTTVNDKCALKLSVI